jgi:serine/threonine-protein kinase RsbW
MKIWDVGEPFDLEAQLSEALYNPNQPLDKESDRGLFLMKQLTDELYYQRISEQQNCLIMRKYFDIS